MGASSTLKFNFRRLSRVPKKDTEWAMALLHSDNAVLDSGRCSRLRRLWVWMARLWNRQRAMQGRRKTLARRRDSVYTKNKFAGLAMRARYRCRLLVIEQHGLKIKATYMQEDI